jgi:hypothetical protein
MILTRPSALCSEGRSFKVVSVSLLLCVVDRLSISV